MHATYSLEQLADAVQSWCHQHRVQPENGQASVTVSERNIRYYRSLGLVDGPAGPGPRPFTEKHRLQLVALRLLQAKGLPLRRIRDLLYGLDLAQLEELERRGLEELAEPPVGPVRPERPEQWSVWPLTGDYLLVSRTGREVPRPLRQRLAALLASAEAPVPSLLNPPRSTDRGH